MDIVTLAAARKSGGSGGGVTKQYVDDHLALKADKTETAEYPIASTTTGINPSITDSAPGYVQSITIYGRTDAVEGELRGIGEDGELEITTENSDNTASTTATVTTGIPLYSVGDVKNELDEKKGVVVKRTYKVTFDGSEDEGWTMPYDSMFLLTLSPLPVYRLGYITTLCNNYPAVPSDHSFVNLLSYNKAETITTNNRLVIIDKSFTSLIDFKTYLASNPLEVVYILATSTTQELTTEERQALLALRTFDSTTNVTITDDPFVDISYIKNTANGKAAEQLADNLRASIGWIANVPEMHRNIFRGKPLGSAVSAAQLAAIADGSFDDLYVGDYWTIPVTIGGVTKNINWRIADIDYYLNAGDTPLEEHHLVIVPDTGLYAARMNATNINTGGYKASEMYTTNLGTAKTAINTAFPDMVLTHRDLMPESPATAPTWADSTAELLSEIMVYGTQIFSPCNGSGQYNNFLTIAKSQLALFRLAPWFGVADDTYWLRDVVGDPSFATVSAEGNADGWGASNEKGVRPYFLLGSAE